MEMTEVEEARAALAKAEANAMKKLGWRSIKSAPKDGSKLHLWMQIYPSPASMGMSDAFAMPDAWFDGANWVHWFRGKPAQLDHNYITHWQPASNALPADMDIWRE